MQQDLARISFQDKKVSLDQLQIPTSESMDQYDTRLVPHISLPQRQQQMDGGQQRRGLLHDYLAASSNTTNDPGLTVAMDKYELARSIAAATQAQLIPQNTLPYAQPTPIPPIAPDAASKHQQKQTRRLTFMKSLLTIELPAWLKNFFFVE